MSTYRCVNVMHDEIDCQTAGLEFEDWCEPCQEAMVTKETHLAYQVMPEREADMYVESIRDSWVRIQQKIDSERKDYDHMRGDTYEYCDVCERLQFDVQVVNTGGREPWTWDSLCVCGACRFNEAIEQAKQEMYMEQCAREEQEWLDNGGQDLIDSEPYHSPEDTEHVKRYLSRDHCSCGHPDPYHCGISE